MCPFCFATAAAIAAGVVSTGGLTALALLKRGSASTLTRTNDAADKSPGPKPQERSR